MPISVEENEVGGTRGGSVLVRFFCFSVQTNAAVSNPNSNESAERCGGWCPHASSSVSPSSRALRSTKRKEQGVNTVGISKRAGVVCVHEAVTATMNLLLMSPRAS